MCIRDSFSTNEPTNVSCVNWNQYYTECKSQGNNPFQGTISFDNIGLAWVAIFLVSYDVQGPCSSLLFGMPYVVPVTFSLISEMQGKYFFARRIGIIPSKVFNFENQRRFTNGFCAKKSDKNREKHESLLALIEKKKERSCFILFKETKIS